MPEGDSLSRSEWDRLTHRRVLAPLRGVRTEVPLSRASAWMSGTSGQEISVENSPKFSPKL
jgi:hypothetical protein